MAHPELEPTDLENESRLHAKVDRLFERDARHHRLTKDILDAEAMLQMECSDSAWVHFLNCEQAGSLRSTFMIAKIVRWAFRAGVIHGSKN